jgi:hypothetical protein
MTMHAEQPRLPRFPVLSRVDIMNFIGSLAVGTSLAMLIPEISDNTAWAIGVALCGFLFTYATSRRGGKDGAKQVIGATTAQTIENSREVKYLKDRITSVESDNATLRSENDQLRQEVTSLNTQMANLRLGGPRD